MLRICTIAGHAAYGMLYKAAARAAKAMGYWRIIAFLPVNGPGSALRAAGWRCAGTVEIKNGDASKKVHYEQWLAVRRRRLEGSEL